MRVWHSEPCVEFSVLEWCGSGYNLEPSGEIVMLRESYHFTDLF